MGSIPGPSECPFCPRLKEVNAALLAACQTMLADVDRYLERRGTLTETEYDHVNRMRVAVAKATGEPSPTQGSE